MMKTIALATSLGVFAAACTQDADIGVEIDPVTCSPTAAATGEVRGSVTTGQYRHDFGATTTTLFASPNAPMVVLADTELGLQLVFGCGPAQKATYDVVANDQRQPACPFEVAGSVSGQIQYMAASDGILIVDETANCLAGRFHVILDRPAGTDSPAGHGDVTGWFSSPWPGTP